MSNGLQIRVLFTEKPQDFIRLTLEVSSPLDRETAMWGAVPGLRALGFYIVSRKRIEFTDYGRFLAELVVKIPTIGKLAPISSRSAR